MQSAEKEPTRGNTKSPTIKQLIIDNFDSDTMALNLEGLSIEEKKCRLRESIAKLEAEEEDQELTKLLAKHEALTKKRSSVTSTPKVTKSKNKKSGKDTQIKKNKKPTKSKTDNKLEPRTPSYNKNGNETGSKPTFDTDEFVKSKLPDITGFQDLLCFSQAGIKQCKRYKKSKKRKTKHPSSSSDSSTEESGSLSSDSESEEVTPPPARRKEKKGRKKVSGLYARAGKTRIVADELFAHAALEDEVGIERDLKSLSFNLFVTGELEIISDQTYLNKRDIPEWKF